MGKDNVPFCAIRICFLLVSHFEPFIS
uniref:Uncharacterized protein n=1 Tax=Rhizophora mucronata TaxID=61149 RepID=A0A2P2P234_RHIMU